MKRIANYLIVLALAVFTFTSCEDIPSPFGQIVAPKADDGVVIEPSGKGTLADPYNVAGALEFIAGLGADVQSPTDVYIKGYVTTITEAFGTQYGNATFEISDTKEGANKFLCYRVKYFGGQGYSDPSATNIKEGDEVIICGKVVNYKGNTPETASNAAYVYSINGKGGGTTPPDPGTGDAKGKGTQDDPFNIAAAIKKCQEVGETASTDKYYIKGIVVKGGTVSGGYGNLTFTMGDTKDAKDVFTAFQVAGTDGEKLADGYEVPAGAEVVVYGPVVTYNTTYETAGKSAAQIVTINGKKTNEGGGGDSGGAAGDGSQSNPYNVAAITEICEKLGDKETSATDYYIKGKICSVKYTFSAQYGTATFNISDDGKTGGTEFTAYSVYYFNNAAWVDGNTQIAVGDDVVLFGKITNYGGTLETASKKACIYSINGKTSDGGSGGGDTGGNEISVAASSFGLENGVEVGTQTLTDGTKLTFESGGNSNAPKYYTAGNGTIRMYPKNTMAIDAGSKKIASIEIVCNEYNGTLYNASGNVNATSGTKAVDGNSLKFTGINASSVTITNVAEGSGAATQIRLETLKITYAK